jgi:hypothetical protein
MLSRYAPLLARTWSARWTTRSARSNSHVTWLKTRPHEAKRASVHYNETRQGQQCASQKSFFDSCLLSRNLRKGTIPTPNIGRHFFLATPLAKTKSRPMLGLSENIDIFKGKNFSLSRAHMESDEQAPEAFRSHFIPKWH